MKRLFLLLAVTAFVVSPLMTSSAHAAIGKDHARHHQKAGKHHAKHHAAKHHSGKHAGKHAAKHAKSRHHASRI